MFQENELYGNQCKYRAEIEQCRQENLSWDPRSLDFLCPQNRDTQFQTYQIVLDGEFNEIDLEIDNYLTQLQAQKKRFYGWEKSYLDGYDEISQKFWPYGEYWKRYSQLCDISQENSIVQQSLSCLDDTSSTIQALEFFQSSKCAEIIDTKLFIYREVADDILYLNKAQLISDSQKTFHSAQRNTYSTLVDLMSHNIGLIHRIVKKYPSRNQYNALGG